MLPEDYQWMGGKRHTVNCMLMYAYMYVALVNELTNDFIAHAIRKLCRYEK